MRPSQADQSADGDPIPPLRATPRPTRKGAEPHGTRIHGAPWPTPQRCATARYRGALFLGSRQGPPTMGTSKTRGPPPKSIDPLTPAWHSRDAGRQCGSPSGSPGQGARPILQPRKVEFRGSRGGPVLTGSSGHILVQGHRQSVSPAGQCPRRDAEGGSYSAQS